jgi:hypothetical protein
VGKSLQEVKELVYQQFWHLAVTHFTEWENREELGQFYLHNALDLPQELYHFVEQKWSFELGYTAYVQIFGKLCFRNPIYRISSDRAIQMDYNSITPQYFYDIWGEQLLWESELYRNIFSTVDEIFLSRPGTNDEDYM